MRLWFMAFHSFTHSFPIFRNFTLLIEIEQSLVVLPLFVSYFFLLFALSPSFSFIFCLQLNINTHPNPNQIKKSQYRIWKITNEIVMWCEKSPSKKWYIINISFILPPAIKHNKTFTWMACLARRLLVGGSYFIVVDGRRQYGYLRKDNCK